MTVTRPPEFSNLLEGYFPNAAEIPTRDVPPDLIDYMPWETHDEIWNKFVETYNITPATDLDGTIKVGYGKIASIRTLFEDFVQTKCLQSFLSQDSLWQDFTNVYTLPLSSKLSDGIDLNNDDKIDTYVKDLFNQYVQELAWGVSSNSIWQAFVALYGITPGTNINGTIDLGSQVSVKVLFNQFVQKAYLDLQNVSMISDDEVKGRRLVYTIMDILLLLIKAMQDNAAVVGNTILYLGKKQKEYNEQIASIAFYRGGSDVYGSIDRTDLSKWTLGYADISIEDYLLSAIVPRTLDINEEGDTSIPVGYQDLVLNATPTQDFLSVFGSTIDIPITLDIVNSAIPLASPITENVNTNSYRLEFRANDDELNIELFMRLPQYVFNGSSFVVQEIDTSILKTVAFDVNESVASKFEKAKALFNELLNQSEFQTTSSNITYGLVATGDPPFGATLGDFMTDPRIPFHTKWDNQLNRPLDDDNTGNSAQLRGGQARAAKNQVLQQFLENARTRKDVVADFQDTMQTTFDASKEGLTRATDLINSVIKQLINILSSIFQVH